MAVALCAAACVATTAFAEDDFGIESASQVKIADPINPQPGMVVNAYKIRREITSDYKTQTALSALAKTAALETIVDKSDSFSRNILPKKCEARTILWEGFIKCITKGTYTFSMSNNDWYSFYVDGKCYFDQKQGQQAVDVDMKVGWNKISIVSLIAYANEKLEVSFKPKGSLSDPRPIAPKDLFHDQPPETPW